MRTSSILALIFAGICTAAAADDRKAQSEDMLKQAKAEQRALVKAMAGPSQADVGDPDSFGRNVHFLGVAQTGGVTVTGPGGCPPPDPNFPDDRCVEANPTAFIEARDIGRINLPAKASNSILCHSLTSLPIWTFSNPTTFRVFAAFQYTASVTIENEVLNDPSLIDPNTGLPFNGKLEVAFGLITDRQTMQPGDVATRRHSSTRACIGGLVSKMALTQGFGLTDAQADAFFKKPMTLRLNITLSTAFVDNAFVLFGLRLFGD